jgi:hypothetical protein
MPPDSWHPSSPRSMAPNQYNNFGSDNHLALGGAVTSADTVCFKSFLFYGFTFYSFPDLFSPKHDRLVFGLRCFLEMAPYQFRQLCQLHHMWYNLEYYNLLKFHDFLSIEIVISL